MIHTIGLGAGWQSSTMALKAMHGELLPMPVAAIFADTQWEPPEVMDYLSWLESVLPFPVYRVEAKGISLRERVLAATKHGVKRHMPIPVFTREGLKRGRGRRHCTRDYKIRPIERKLKQLIGHKPYSALPKAPVLTHWIGISTDESHRMKPSGADWYQTRHPLIWDAGMSRDDCMAWIREHGYPRPPRSACIGCPFHSDYEWWRIRQDADLWKDAVEIDEAIRHSGGMRGECFLHSSARPLTEAVPLEEPSKPKSKIEQLSLFGNECTGFCGV